MARAQTSIGRRLAQTGRDQSDASNPALSVWVSANAGTGKTHVLTMRVLRLLLAGTRPEAILCLTYTKAAAAEMSKRVFDELAKWVTAGDDRLAHELERLTGEPPSAETMTTARTLFTAAIETPGGLKIQTIHSFAEKLLQRFPLEAGVAPGFAILDEQEARTLKREAIDATLSDATAQSGGELGRALTTAIAYATEDRFEDLLSAAIKHRAWLIAANQMGFGEAEALLRKHFGVRKTADQGRLEFELGSLLGKSELERLRSVLLGGTTADLKAAELVGAAVHAPTTEIRGEALAHFFLTQKGEARSRLMTTALKAAHPDLDARLQSAQERYVRLAEELIGLEAVDASMSLYRLADAVLQRYSEAKSRRAALDFDDLIAKTSSLLRVRDSAEWVLYKLDSGLAHILVDESQDTAPEQWRIIEALGGEFFSGTGAREDKRTLFAVGDEKQSIYSFQGAEAGEFARMGKRFTALAEGAGAEWRTVPLNLSFRTVEPILAAVDTVFAGAARAPGVKSRGAIVHHARRAGQAGLVEVWPTETYDAPEATDPWSPLAEGTQSSPVARLAARVADTIQGWLASGEKLVSENRLVRPGDILILVRKRNPFAGPMTAALKSRGIRVAGADRIRLTEHIAVQDLMALAEFLTLPEDDLSLATVLKSPIFGLDDDDLLALAANRKGTLWRSLLAHAEVRPAYASAAHTLKDWRRRADFLPPYEFLATLLDKDGVRAKLLARLGPDAADAIDELVNLAITYDDGAPPSLSGFLTWLRDDAREVKRDMEHGRNEVRVMTVHGAKGLEAPIVFLPDTCTTASGGKQGINLVTLDGVSPAETADPFAWCVKGTTGLTPIAAANATAAAREAAERNRLLYVAMTRARDRLYVAGFENKSGRAQGCWYDLIVESLRPSLAEHALADGRKVWRLESQQTTATEMPRGNSAAELAPQPLPAWAKSPAPREPQLAVPLAPSRLAPYETDEEGEPSPKPAPLDRLAEPPPQSPVPPSPAKGAATDQSRFLRGSLTHALLQHLPGLAPAQWQTAGIAFLSRRGAGLPQRTLESISAEVVTVLGHPRFVPLFGPASQAEVPIVAEIPRPRGSGPALKLTGQIDRLADTGREVLIVDYKTNRVAPADLAQVAEVYLYQLAAYRLAIAHIFAKPVRAALLWTSVPVLMEIPDAVLDDYATRLWTLDAYRLDG